MQSGSIARSSRELAGFVVPRLSAANGTIGRSSLRQTCLTQAIREDGNVLRPADRQPIREIGDAEGGIELAQVVRRTLRLVGPSGTRMAGSHDGDHHQKTRQVAK